MSSLRKSDAVRKTIFLSEQSAEWIERQREKENRNFSNMVDTLILRYIDGQPSRLQDGCQ